MQGQLAQASADIHQYFLMLKYSEQAEQRTYGKSSLLREQLHMALLNCQVAEHCSCLHAYLSCCFQALLLLLLLLVVVVLLLLQLWRWVLGCMVNQDLHTINSRRLLGKEFQPCTGCENSQTPTCKLQ